MSKIKSTFFLEKKSELAIVMVMLKCELFRIFVIRPWIGGRSFDGQRKGNRFWI